MDLVAIIWLGLLIVFLVVEAVCAVHLVSIWFAAGSLAALAVWALHGPLWLQILVFLAVSGGLLAALWPITKKFLKPRLTSTNVDSVIGSCGLVTAPIDNVSASGQPARTAAAFRSCGIRTPITVSSGTVGIKLH